MEETNYEIFPNNFYSLLEDGRKGKEIILKIFLNSFHNKHAGSQFKGKTINTQPCGIWKKNARHRHNGDVCTVLF